MKKILSRLIFCLAATYAALAQPTADPAVGISFQPPNQAAHIYETSSQHVITFSNALASDTAVFNFFGAPAWIVDSGFDANNQKRRFTILENTGVSPRAATVALRRNSTTYPAREVWQGGSLGVVNSASFVAGSTPNKIPHDSFAAAYGGNMANGTYTPSAPWPTLHQGTKVVLKRLRDDTTYDGPLLFVSPGQVNFQITDQWANLASADDYLVAVINTNGVTNISVKNVYISNVAPAMYSANSSGQGAPSAILYRVLADGVTVLQERVTNPDGSLRKLQWNDPAEKLILSVYGNGWRYRAGTRAVENGVTKKYVNGTASLSNVQGIINQVVCTVEYAGIAPGLLSLDQMNIVLNPALANAGNVELKLRVDTIFSSNTGTGIRLLF